VGRYFQEERIYEKIPGKDVTYLPYTDIVSPLASGGPGQAGGFPTFLKE